MVTIRESPRAKVSPDKSSTQWPPKSPFHALLSSPGGRRKWQDRRAGAEERSPSPSPMRRPMSSSKALQDVAMASDDDEEEEDEETLRLQMQAIQTKLKLKALQKKKKSAAGTDTKENSSRTSSRTDSIPTSPRKSLRPSTSQPNLRGPEVEVELSPVKDRFAPAEPVSPARRRLGLSAAASAQDVSLKRARDGTQIKRSDSVRSALDYGAPKPKSSFSERLQASKHQADEREAKYERIERTRSKGFSSRDAALGETRQPVDKSRTSGVRGKDEAKRPSSSRSTQNSSRPSKASSTTQSASTRGSQPSAPSRPRPNGMFQTTGRTQDKPSRGPGDSDSDLSVAPPEDDASPSSYDPISEIHLSKRHIPHAVVAREMEGKEIYTLPRLLKEVKSPHYDPPDCEDDFVVFAILASKSTPYDQKAKHKTSDMDKPQEDAEAPRNKFMVLHLTDLKWTVDCFLFGTAFDQFWKLTPGTLLAILNPAIMPPKTNQHSGRFSLKLGSSEDCVMELGVARDLGYCNSVKKDGEQCGEWIDKRSTNICEFHLNLFIEKQRKGRMEVNSMWRGTGDTDLRTKSQAREKGGFDKQTKKQKGVTSHREYGTLYSVPGAVGGKSAANLLDAEDTDALHGFTADEASRKRIAAAQRERDLAKDLARMGSGVGAEYMQATTGIAKPTNGATDAKGMFEKPKAADLGLLNNKAMTAHLSPAKDRKHHFGLGAVSSTGRDAMGWGGARKPGLLQPKEKRLGSPERGQTKLSAIRPPAVRARSTEDGSLSPKKRARFMLDKGIREPGRESGGQDLKKLDDDEDELDIV